MHPLKYARYVTVRSVGAKSGNAIGNRLNTAANAAVVNAILQHLKS